MPVRHRNGKSVIESPPGILVGSDLAARPGLARMARSGASSLVPFVGLRQQLGDFRHVEVPRGEVKAASGGFPGNIWSRVRLLLSV